MTATKKQKPGTEKLLEHILETVESVDKNVEEIRDQLADHLDHVKYASWRDDAYVCRNGYE